MTPLIGVTAGHRDVESPGGTDRAHLLYVSYTRRVKDAGGIPVIPAALPAQQVPELLDRFDGIVLTGGGDLDPARYGRTEHPEVYRVDEERDEFELAIARQAAARRMPMLAICRGMQVLNVAMGGTLYVDLPTEVPEAIPHRVRGEDAYRGIQEITIEPGSTTAAAVGATAVKVNSIHHQAIRDLAPGFRVTATAEDGIIEAIESEDPAWPMWAVQWHPERLAGEPSSERLFAALIEAATRAG